MFKSGLIDEPSFYPLKYRVGIVSLAAGAIAGTLQLFFRNHNLILFIILFGIYLYAMYYQYQLNKKLKRLTKNRRIEMDKNTLWIKDMKGGILEEIDMNNVNEIMIQEEYGFEEPNTKQHLSQNYKRNLFVVKTDDKEIEYDIVPDSSYMLVQLDKLTDHWKTKGISVVKMSN